MEALRRRQEKELSKIVEREQVMADLLNKIKKAEEEEIKKKKIHEKKVAEQKVIEAKKRAQREQEKKQIEAEEVQRKKELLKREAEVNDKIAKSRLENERKLEREARLRDEERKKKVEEARKKTEALIKQQEEMAEQNRIKMMEREAKIIQQLEEKKEKKRLEVQMQREKATKRINEAIEKHHEIFVQKKVAFDTAQSEAAKRAKENEIAERERLRKQADDRERRAKQRMGRLVDAYNNRKQHRQSIVEIRQEKEEVYGTIRSQREEKIAMMKFTSDLKLRDKLENVERVARINEFHRLQTLQKIHEQDMRYEKIQQQKEEMLKNHREESKQALQRKHEISDVMEKMRLTNDFTLMDKLFTTKKKKRASTRGGDDGEGEDPRLNQTI